MTTRIDRRFADLKRQNRSALVAFVTGGDPDYETSLAIIKGMPQAGADVIEIGMPFSDPLADGPAIQAAGLRALKAGQTMAKTLAMVKSFREDDDETPIVLMGYYNPIYSYGTLRFLDDAKQAGVDGFIIIDLPAEMDEELCLPALDRGLNFIRLATPTTDDKRLPRVLANTSGFLYYVSITGITGTKTPDFDEVAKSVARIRLKTELPICVGFGVRTAEHANKVARTSDGVAVGTVLVNAIADNLDDDGNATGSTISAVTDLVADLARGVRSARLDQ